MENKTLIENQHRISAYHSQKRSEMVPFVNTSLTSIIDIGCGEARFLNHLADLGHMDLVGVEPNKVAATIAAKDKRLKIINSDVESYLQKTDFSEPVNIFFNDILEHTEDPWSILQLVSDKLVKGSRVIVSIPNFRYILNLRHILFEKDFEYAESGILDITHLRFLR